MDMIKKIDQYFNTVSDDKLFTDLRAAGFVVISKELYSAERASTMEYSRVSFYVCPPAEFFCDDIEPAA